MPQTIDSRCHRYFSSNPSLPPQIQTAVLLSAASATVAIFVFSHTFVTAAQVPKSIKKIIKELKELKEIN